jgi:hypothetical protein
LYHQKETNMATQVYTVTVDEIRTVWRNAKGQVHRTDGPAIEYANGSKKWFQNDILYRTDGPAIELANGDKLWCIDGDLLDESEFLTKIKGLTMDEITEKFGIPVSQLNI